MAIAVGDVAPDFTLSGTGGRSYSLAEFRGAPVVLVLRFEAGLAPQRSTLVFVQMPFGLFVILISTDKGISVHSWYPTLDRFYFVIIFSRLSFSPGLLKLFILQGKTLCSKSIH